MIGRHATPLLGLCLAIAAASLLSPAAAQQWVVPRTPEGHPDLQGNWTNATLTPFERRVGQGPVMTPDEVENVRQLMREQRPLLRYYTNDVTSWEQALASGEVIAAASWNDTATRLSKDGLPVMFMNPKEGPMTWTCGLVLNSWIKPEMEDAPTT